jgi:hypothetical protein
MNNDQDENKGLTSNPFPTSAGAFLAICHIIQITDGRSGEYYRFAPSRME